MNPLHSQLLGTSCMQVMLLLKIPLPKKLYEKIARFSTQKIDPASGVISLLLLLRFLLHPKTLFQIWLNA